MTNAYGAGGKIKTGLEDVTVSFGERFACSEKFDTIFKEGMALVERAANYLDGPGRVERKSLSEASGLAYAAESMRLTTRLMSVASWLLVGRAQKDGDISADEARKKRQHLKLCRIGRPEHVASFDDLPSAMRRIIRESHALNDRIIQLDRAIEGGGLAAGSQAASPPVNVVGAQTARIEAAFARRHPRAD